MHDKTTKKSSACFLWWLTVLLIGALLWYALYFFATSKKAHAIESDIHQRTVAELHADQELQSIQIDADGRDIFLRGHTSSTALRDKAEQLATQVLGVRIVNNEIEVAANTQAVTNTEDTSPVTSTVSDAPKLLAKVEPLPETFAPLEEDSPAEPSVTENPVVEEKPQVEIDTAAAKAIISNLDLENISFLLNSATLTPEAHQALDEVVARFRDFPGIRLRIEGHTDSIGDPSYNLELSTKRAQAVRQYLVEQGIGNTRLEAQGFGHQNPIASNDTRDGRRKNRRIEFKLIDGEE